MKAHQILYTKPMIFAKLNGWKTVTRRPIKQEIPDPSGSWPPKWGNPKWDGSTITLNDGIGNLIELESPYAQPGDQLWTKENFEILDFSGFPQSVKVRYCADDHTTWVQLHPKDWEKYRQWKQPTGKKSKLFMFKTLSRFWDEVTEISVERIQDITPKECWNEGIRIPRSEYRSRKFEPPSLVEVPYLQKFESLWQSMYEGGPFDWDNNPWVFAVRYKPIIVNGEPATSNPQLATP